MSGFNLMDYAPIGLMFIVAAGFAVSQLLVTQLIGPRKRTAVKLMPYECGKDPVGSARDRFSVKFYSVAVLFLLFDLEVLFIIPFAVAFKTLLAEEKLQNVPYGTIALVEILAFISTAIIGLIFAWKKGAFDWNIQARVEAKQEARALKIERKKRIQELNRAA
jgi:NADH-quinone oxidoreductase subunit A